MTAATLLMLTFIPVAVAALIGLVGDMLDRPGVSSALAAAALVGAGCFAVWAAWSLPPAASEVGLLSGGAYSLTSGVVLLLSGLAVAATGRGTNQARTATLIAIGAGGASLAACASDLLVMLIAIELTALAAYALVSASRTPESSEAALKYFVQGAVATGLFVLGMALLVGVFVPTTSLAALTGGVEARLDLSLLATVGTLALVSALLFKAGAAPMHAWAPDAYEHAPATSAAALAGAFKVGMLAAAATVVAAFGVLGAGASDALGPMLLPVFGAVGAIAAVSVVVGSTVALRTGSYRRMLAYAGIAQVGYALIALAALNPPASLVLIVTYGVAATGAFVAADVFEGIVPDWDGSIDGLAGVGRQHPAIGAAMTVVMFSLAGIPPLVGFWGKFQAFAAAIRTTTLFFTDGRVSIAAWMGTLAVIGIVGSIVSVAYYGNVVRVLVLGDPRAEQEPGNGARRGSTVVLVGLALAVVLLGLAPLVVGLSESVRGFLLS